MADQDIKNNTLKIPENVQTGAPKKRLILIVVGVIILLAAAGGGYLLWNNKQADKSASTDSAESDSETIQASKSLQQGNLSEALEHARRAMVESPNDIDAIMTAADLAEQTNAEDTKQLYAVALEVHKQQEQPDADGKSPGVYLAAGLLAEKAGLNDQARQYYQRAINAADPSNSDDAITIAQAQEALGRLQ